MFRGLHPSALTVFIAEFGSQQICFRTALQSRWLGFRTLKVQTQNPRPKATPRSLGCQQLCWLPACEAAAAVDAGRGASLPDTVMFSVLRVHCVPGSL